MKTVKGYLELLGDSTQNIRERFKTYSLIKVGDEVIPDVQVSSKLANFVSHGVGEEVTLHLHGSYIVACVVNGKTYYDSKFRSGSGLLIALVCGAAAFFLLPLTLGFIYMAMGLIKPHIIVIFAFMIMFPVGGWIGFSWATRMFGVPSEFAQWKAQGAIAV